MKNFIYEDGYFFCKKCESENKCENVRVFTLAIISFEEELGQLRKPQVEKLVNVNNSNSYPIIRCETCGSKEILSNYKVHGKHQRFYIEKIG